MKFRGICVKKQQGMYSLDPLPNSIFITSILCAGSMGDELNIQRAAYRKFTDEGNFTDE